MPEESERTAEHTYQTRARPGTGVGLVVALAAVAAVGTGILVQQILDRRLSKHEVARLRFLRYLRERGHLES